MARVTYGSLVTELAGSVGGSTFQKNSSGNIVRSKPNTAVNPSVKQSGRELMLGYLASVWSSLTLEQKQGWSDLALNNTHYDPFGKITKLNGFQQFQSNNINLSVIELAHISDAPAYLLPTPPDAFTLKFTDTKIYLEFAAPYDPSPYNFVLYVTPPLRQSNLNTRKNTFLLEGGTWSSSTIFDITSPYLAYFNIYYPLFISSVDCTIISRACVIDPVTGFRSVFSSSSAKPITTFSNFIDLSSYLWFGSVGIDVDWGDGISQALIDSGNFTLDHFYPDDTVHSCVIDINILGSHFVYNFSISEIHATIPVYLTWHGTRSGALNPAVSSPSADTVRFTWENNSSAPESSASDLTLLGLFSPDHNQTVYFRYLTTRADLLQDVTVPGNWSGHSVECYISFVNSGLTSYADTLFIGNVSVL